MRHEIPSEFSDEEKWLNFFSKKAFIWGGATLGIGLVLANVLKPFGLFVPMLVISIIATLAMVGLIMIKKPEGDYVNGSGLSYMEILLRIKGRRSRKVIYLLGYDEIDRFYGERDAMKKGAKK